MWVEKGLRSWAEQGVGKGYCSPRVLWMVQDYDIGFSGRVLKSLLACLLYAIEMHRNKSVPLRTMS